MIPNQVPVFIVNRNRVTTTRDLVNWLKDAGTKSITILDNDSDYPPLLEYYQSLPEGVTVYKTGGNLGCQVFWNPLRWHLVQNTPYVLTDSDIVPDVQCPKDLMRHLLALLDRFPKAGKVGTGLRLDNIPDCYSHKIEVQKWEARFWKKKACQGAFFADIDTTFALYPAKTGWSNHNGNIRTDFPYVAEHRPWYVDSKNLPKEDQYYLDHLGKDSTHWNGNGRMP